MLEMDDTKKQLEEELKEAAIRDYIFKLKVQERLESDALELAEARGIEMIAKKMYEKGISKEVICEVTELSEQALNAILL